MRCECHYSILPGEDGDFYGILLITWLTSDGKGPPNTTHTCYVHGKYGEGSLASVF